jgi:hypothetical protein
VQISTSEYKIKAIKREVRSRLGYPGRRRIPPHVWAESVIGISVDEIGRARDSGVAYLHNTYPLLDLGWTRQRCREFLAENGLADTPKSACIGCPYHTDAWWQALKDESPAEWADAVAFDHAIRHGSARATADGHPLRGTFYLHRQRVPLDEVVLRPRTTEPDDAPGCGPWTCHQPVMFTQPSDGEVA